MLPLLGKECSPSKGRKLSNLDLWFQCRVGAEADGVGSPRGRRCYQQRRQEHDHPGKAQHVGHFVWRGRWLLGIEPRALCVPSKHLATELDSTLGIYS